MFVWLSYSTFGWRAHTHSAFLSSAWARSAWAAAHASPPRSCCAAHHCGHCLRPHCLHQPQSRRCQSQPHQQHLRALLARACCFHRRLPQQGPVRAGSRASTACSDGWDGPLTALTHRPTWFLKRCRSPAYLKVPRNTPRHVAAWRSERQWRPCCCYALEHLRVMSPSDPLSLPYRNRGAPAHSLRHRESHCCLAPASARHARLCRRKGRDCPLQSELAP